MNKKMSTAEKLTILIRMCREFDTKKNNEKQTKAFLNVLAYELELILGGFYE